MRTQWAAEDTGGAERLPTPSLGENVNPHSYTSDTVSVSYHSCHGLNLQLLVRVSDADGELLPAPVVHLILLSNCCGDRVYDGYALEEGPVCVGCDRAQPPSLCAVGPEVSTGLGPAVEVLSRALEETLGFGTLESVVAAHETLEEVLEILEEVEEPKWMAEVGAELDRLWTSPAGVR